MGIIVSGSIQTGENFNSYVEDKFEKELSKFNIDLPSSEVCLTKQGDLVNTSITIIDPKKKGTTINATAQNVDAYTSFDEAFKKLFTQIKKIKDKIVSEKRKIKKI